MRIKFCLSIMTILMITSCTVTPTPAPTSKPVPTFPSKQPEPQRPLIGGKVLGLSDDTLLTIHVNTPEGREALYHTQRGNGHWEIVVTNASGVDYVITAEADGYDSSPFSYTIHLSDTIAYVVEAGQITQNKALHLDFQFTSSNSPIY